MLTVQEFGKSLIRTRDLDPVYVAIAETDLEFDLKARLLLAYWCFYSLGAASLIAERSSDDHSFWKLMHQAAANEVGPFKSIPSKRWPRSAERRHFRGAQAVDAVAGLKSMFKGDSQRLFRWLTWMDTGDMVTDYQPVSFNNIAARASELRGFGPWITFKIADMTDRVVRRPVQFDTVALDMYKDPRQGAALVYFEGEGLGAHYADMGYKSTPWEYPINHEQFEQTCKLWVKHFKKFKAPPFEDRPCNIQEVETVFCKYKSYRKGHYWVGKDTLEVHHGLQGWGDIADQFDEVIVGLINKHRNEYDARTS